jgi:pimeloyl-ACP methyl ester carboxylesterase
MSPDLSLNKDSLIAGRVIEKLKLARLLPEVNVYHDLLESLRDYAGYEERDWNYSGADGTRDSFYVFPYDWRQDNVTNARELVRRIRELKTRLNREDLKFNIVAHSMGGLIARYAAMYGDADLPPGEGEIRPTWAGAAHINKIVMIGVPNEGSSDAFSTLIAGYSITEGIRRRIPLLNKLTAEDAISTPSVFQLMPHSGTEKFLDENLRPLAVDLYDVNVWKTYGWSPLFSPEFIRRSNRQVGELEAYLAATLKRTKRFHQALDAAVEGTRPVALLAIGGDCEETLNAPVILRDAKRNRWTTLIRPREYRTSAGVKMSKKQVLEAMYLPGDGRVTRSSLLGENLMRANTDQSTLSLFAVFGCDLHGALPRNKSLQDNALTTIVNEVVK